VERRPAAREKRRSARPAAAGAGGNALRACAGAPDRAPGAGEGGAAVPAEPLSPEKRRFVSRVAPWRLGLRQEPPPVQLLGLGEPRWSVAGTEVKLAAGELW